MKQLVLFAIAALTFGCVTSSDGTTRVDWEGVGRGVQIAGQAVRDYKAIKELK
jgi:hypothetical protein